MSQPEPDLAQTPTVLERAAVSLAAELDVEAEARELAWKAIFDDEIFYMDWYSRQRARAMLPPEAPSTWFGLLGKVEEAQLKFRFRVIGTSPVDAAIFDLDPVSLLRGLVLPVARFKIAEEPPPKVKYLSTRKALAAEGITLAPDDDGPEIVDRLSDGIFDAERAAPFELDSDDDPDDGYFTDILAKRRALVPLLLELFPQSELTDPEYDTILGAIEGIAEVTEDLACKRDGSNNERTVQVFRALARLLAPAGVRLETHELFLRVMTGKLMDLGDLVGRRVPSDTLKARDRDRNKQVERAIGRYDAKHGAGAAVRGLP
jgi:hypothetical protein